MTKLLKIEGIGTAVATKLQDAGVRSVEELLEVGRTPDGRAKLAQATSIPSRRLLHFVHRADLARVNGVGEEYAELLEVAGVGNVDLLANADVDMLLAKLKDVNKYRRLVRRLPSRRLVLGWVEKAQGLPPVVTY